MSLVPETWHLLTQATDPDTGLPMALVARQKHSVTDRLTVWKLAKRSGAWYNAAQWVSKGYWRTYPEKNGVKLTDSRIDRMLKQYAEGEVM